MFAIVKYWYYVKMQYKSKYKIWSTKKLYFVIFADRPCLQEFTISKGG